LRKLSWHRLRRFVLNAGRLIIPVCIVIGALNHIDHHGKWLDETAQQKSLLATVGKQIVPIFAPLGMEEDNWPAAVGLITGVLAKEVVIGTLNSLYADPKEEEGTEFHLQEHMYEAFKSIGENLLALRYAWQNPIKAKSPEATMLHHAHGEMVKRFEGKANAFAYLLFVLLYFPCISATAAMVREVQRGWTIFSVCWTTGLAYATAVFYYQVATIASHPLQTMAWVGGLSAVGFAAWFGVRHYAGGHLWRTVPTPIVVFR
jgi:ferrous iron transport protein B